MTSSNGMAQSQEEISLRNESLALCTVILQSSQSAVYGKVL